MPSCSVHVAMPHLFEHEEYLGSGNHGLPCVCCRVGQYTEGEQVGSASEFAGRVFTTAYMGTENSSAETRQRAATLAAEVGAHHLDLNIDTVVAALTALFAAVTGRKPAFKVGFRACTRPDHNSLTLCAIQRPPRIFACVAADLLLLYTRCWRTTSSCSLVT